MASPSRDRSRPWRPAAALDAMATEAARTYPESALGLLQASGVPVRGSDVVTAAHEGDSPARALLVLVGERLGVGIANVINTLDPEVVVIGGGVSRAGELLLGPARESARRFVVPGAGEATEIRVAKYGEEAGCAGRPCSPGTNWPLPRR